MSRAHGSLRRGRRLSDVRSDGQALTPSWSESDSVQARGAATRAAAPAWAWAAGGASGWAQARDRVLPARTPGLAGGGPITTLPDLTYTEVFFPEKGAVATCIYSLKHFYIFKF